MAIGIGAAIAISAAVQGISAIAQYYQRAKAEKAAQSELNEIKKAYQAIVPPDFEYDIEDPPELIAEAAGTVDYDWSQITPEEYKVIGKYAPNLAPYVAEQSPQLVTDSPTGRDALEAQVGALQRFQQIAEGGIDPQFAQRMREADQASQIAAQSRHESLLQDYQRRGLLGSGTQLAADIGAAEGAMQRGAQTSADAATQAYLNQLNALRQSADLGGQIRGTELDIADRNAAIANAFNQRTTRAYQDYLQRSADTINDAMLRNLGVEQGVADKNVAARNEAAVRERDYRDRAAESLRRQKIENIAAENRAKMGNWENALEKLQIENELKGANFDVAMAQAGGRSDIADSIRHRGNIEAQAIQGAGDFITGAMGQYGEAQQRQYDRDRQKRWDDALLGSSYEGGVAYTVPGYPPSEGALPGELRQGFKLKKKRYF